MQAVRNNSKLSDKPVSNGKAKDEGIPDSFYKKTKHLAGSIDSGLGDLSYNKEYRKELVQRVK